MWEKDTLCFSQTGVLGGCINGTRAQFQWWDCNQRLRELHPGHRVWDFHCPDPYTVLPLYIQPAWCQELFLNMNSSSLSSHPLQAFTEFFVLQVVQTSLSLVLCVADSDFCHVYKNLHKNFPPSWVMLPLPCTSVCKAYLCVSNKTLNAKQTLPTLIINKAR